MISCKPPLTGWGHFACSSASAVGSNFGSASCAGFVAIVGTGADELDGKVGRTGICRQQAADLADPSVVAMGEVVRCVGDRRSPRGAARPQQLVLYVAAERADEIQRFRPGMGFHGHAVMLCILSVKSYYNYRIPSGHHLIRNPRSDLGATRQARRRTMALALHWLHPHRMHTCRISETGASAIAVRLAGSRSRRLTPADRRGACRSGRKTGSHPRRTRI